MSHIYTGTTPEATKPRRGRPPGTGTGKTRTTTSLSLPSALLARLQESAAVHEISLSRHVEELLRQAIQAKGGQAE